MFVIFRDGNQVCVRPAYIGFIKNTKVRRTFMVLFLIPVLMATISLNILVAAFVFLVKLVRGIVLPLYNLIKNPIWEYPVWNNPREK